MVKIKFSITLIINLFVLIVFSQTSIATDKQKTIIKVEKNNFGNIQHQSLIFISPKDNIEVLINSNFFCEPKEEVRLGRFIFKPSKTISANVKLLGELEKRNQDILIGKPHGEKLNFVYNKKFIKENTLMSKTIENIQIEICENINKLIDIDSVKVKVSSKLEIHKAKNVSDKNKIKTIEKSEVNFNKNCKDFEKYINCQIPNWGDAYLIREVIPVSPKK